jgi:hypothetical protein
MGGRVMSDDNLSTFFFYYTVEDNHAGKYFRTNRKGQKNW